MVKKMQQLMVLSVVVANLMFAGCSSNTETRTELIATPATPVEVVCIGSGTVNNELTFFGTTIYLKRSLVSATIPAYIVQVKVTLGDRVTKGDVLYVLQSKESRALGTRMPIEDSALRGFGIITVTAPASGIISTLDRQQPGDYVMEGAQLCTVAESNDLAVQVNVPYEYSAYTKQGSRCTVYLPDNTIHSATFTNSLTAMNVTAQTQTILAKISDQLYVPENMIVKVCVDNRSQHSSQIVPRSCVLSDETMREYWVMKMVDDSTAVKIPVLIGNSSSESIEILSPMFAPRDRIVSKGNYGLPDTAIVAVTKSTAQ